jgi:thiamine monophosphate synthase
MFSLKNQYYLFIENTTNFDFNLIKTRNKFNIIYRNYKKTEDTEILKKFRKQCNIKGICLFVANNLKLLNDINADGLYISANNKTFKFNKSVNSKFKIIGSAHDFKEIYIKQKQNCKTIIFSRLFKTNYKEKKDYWGICRFNQISNFYKIEIVPLGGIRLNNLNKLRLVNSNGFSLLSEIKKKPAKIISRLL